MNNSSLITLFLDLVQIGSPTGEEDAICEYIRTYLTKLGYEPYTDSYGNIILHVSGVGKPLFLAAHVDTVEPGRGVKPIIDGDVIRSDGTTILGADNKVGVAIILDVVRTFAQRTDRPALDVVFTRSEESGNYGAINLEYSHITANRGYAFDNPNPVGTIISASPFYSRFDITLLGKSAHASKPERGIHVLPILAECISHIRLGRLSDTALVNIGAIEGGHVRNTIMGEITLHGEVRSMHQEELDQNTNQIKTIFEQIAHKNNIEVTINVVQENGGYIYEQSDPDLQHVVSTMARLGLTPVIKQDWGVADSNIFTDHGIKAINLGDGCEFTHTTREQVRISDMERLKELIMELISS
jgi:tripeptide aminopeptidase